MTAAKPIAVTSAATNPDLDGDPQPFLLVIPGYDATKTQYLENVNGVITWVTVV